MTTPEMPPSAADRQPGTGDAQARPTGTAQVGRLVDQFEKGLDAPICLTWELTYACNLACVHCLSSSGKRDPRELSTEQCKAIIDELERMQVFYVNIGGGGPRCVRTSGNLVDYATSRKGGRQVLHQRTAHRQEGRRPPGCVGLRRRADLARWATAEVNDAVRGKGSFDMAVRALENLHEAGFKTPRSPGDDPP